MWPWVRRIFSTVTRCCAATASNRSRSAPGSVNTPRIVAVHQVSVAFCCSGVTGMMTDCSGGVMGGRWRGGARRSTGSYGPQVYAKSEMELPKLCSRVGSTTLPVRNRSQTAMNAGIAVNAIVSGSNANPPPE